MTKSGFDLDEIERLLAAATGGPWRKGSRRNCDIDIIGKPSWPCKRFGKAGEWDVAVATELENAKEQQANAALIVAARNSLPAMLTEIRELRAENARLKGAIKPQWFYLGDDQSSDKCRFAPYEVIDEDFFCWGERKAEGAHIVHISTALPGPDIWAVVRVLTEAEKDARDDDEPWIIEEYSTEELARAALGEPQ